MESASIRDSLEKAAPYNQDSLILSAIRMRNPLSAAFFAAVPFLWTEKDPSGYIYPGNAIVDKPVSQVSYQRFERISIKPQKGASYKVGDTVDVFSPIRFVRFNSSISNLVKRVARARVIEAGPKRIHAELFEMSDPVKGKERVALSTPFTPKEIDTLVEPEVVIGAEVFTRVEGTVRAYPFQTLILNRGEADGVLLGDVFAVYHKDRPVNNPSFAGIGYVAHLNSNSCSMVIVNLSGEKIEEGDRAALIRRARFRELMGRTLLKFGQMLMVSRRHRSVRQSIILLLPTFFFLRSCFHPRNHPHISGYRKHLPPLTTKALSILNGIFY